MQTAGWPRWPPGGGPPRPVARTATTWPIGSVRASGWQRCVRPWRERAYRYHHAVTDGDGNVQEPTDAPRGVPRRALLGGALGVAAAGIAGYEIADRTGGGPSSEASDVSVVPEGELVADDVQTALVDVYDRTGALARLRDLRTAYEIVDDFPPGATPDRVGSLGWDARATGGGSLNAAPALDGGVVRLATGPSASGSWTGSAMCAAS